MRKYQGKAVGLEESIVGIITKVHKNRLFRHNLIYVSYNLPLNSVGYAAVLTSHYIEDRYMGPKNVPFIQGIERLDELKEGDVVLLEPSGKVNVLYERESVHNALMVTDRCNCSCIMCPQPGTSEDTDFTEINLKLISLIDKKTPHIGITGGEPTLIGDNLFRIIDACKQHFPNTSLILLSNGIKFSDFEYTKALARLRHPDLTIGIPLYADTDLEHNRILGAEGFYKTIEGIYNLALFKEKIEIRTVIHALNYERLPNLAEFIYHNFPFSAHIALMGMETIGLDEEKFNLLWVDPKDYSKQIERAVEYLHRRLMNISIYNVQLCLLPKKLWPFARKSISPWKNIYLEPCKECKLRELCCGFFASEQRRCSKYILPFNELINI